MSVRIVGRYLSMRPRVLKMLGGLTNQQLKSDIPPSSGTHGDVAPAASGFFIVPQHAGCVHNTDGSCCGVY
ncbi:MAG: hypothetical protein GY903_29210 [Fuerstiella sp.]|nr:hypothetical protein [Fuerstiella sp.]MCP4783940.1 hypothetical protein [Fuerstiella sp.]MCP4858576.1 hypothetical protein [Fuerstiella sp.]